jgi:DHA2 family multidrug resistance protein-like MFS transporter
VGIAAARDSLGGAVGVAVRLPGDLGAALLDVARPSFTQGLHAAATADTPGDQELGTDS